MPLANMFPFGLFTGRFIQSPFIIFIFCVSHIQYIKQSRVLCRFIPYEEPLAVHWVTLVYQI